MNELHLFAGCGGGILGGMLLGHRTVCAVEIEPFCRKVLFQRQRDGILPAFPIWDDVRTFDGGPWNGVADVIAGGFPCQDISVAGPGNGIAGARSGLWREMLRVISEVRPKAAFIENSPALAVRGLGVVLNDLASLGYDARWGVFSASSLGAPHQRERLFILAHPQGVPVFQLPKASTPPDAASERQSGSGEYQPSRELEEGPFREAIGIVNAVRESTLPYVCRRHDGMANGVDALKAIGNGQVPIVASTAWRILTNA